MQLIEKYQLKMHIKTINFLAVISGIILTSILTVNFAVYIQYEGYKANDYEVKIQYVTIAVVVMLPIYVYLFQMKNFIFQLAERVSAKVFAFSGIISFFTFLQLRYDTEKNMFHILKALKCKQEIGKNSIVHIIIWILCFLTIFALFIFVAYAFNAIFIWYKDFSKCFETDELIYFAVAFMICVSLICYFFSRTYACWNTVDLVYQSDPYFICNNYYPVFSYGFDFDNDIGIGGIRHPLATLITFPIYIIVSFLSNMFFWIPNVQVILYACIHSVLMILSVIMIKRIINSKWIYILFTLSFPFIFFTIFIEKYALAVFLIVLFVYETVKNKNSIVQKYSLIAAGGMMITNAFLGLLYGKKQNLKDRFTEYVNVVLLFIVTLVATGRIHYILNFYRLIHQNSVMFYESSVQEFGLRERFFGFTNLCASGLLPAPYEGRDVNFYWTHLTDHINYFGVAVIIIVLYACIKYRKNKQILPFILWFFFSVIQFVIIGFGIESAPLFSLCYSWASVPLFILGIHMLARKEKVRNVVYICLCTVMFYMNFIHFEELLNYLLVKAPL